MKQLNKEQAIAFSKSGAWEDMDSRQIAEFQIEQKLRCMPFSVFHEAMEKALGRAVYTHELANTESLKKELFGKKEPPSLEAIINLIPEEKRIIIQM